MSLIVGVEFCKMDSNGRFKLPVALKKQIVVGDDVRFVIRKSIYNSCLELFTYSDFGRKLRDFKLILILTILKPSGYIGD